MRTRPVLSLSCVALVLGAANVFGQPAAPGDCPPPADCCAPKPCLIKSFCDHFKGAPVHKECAPAHKPACAPAPKVTVIVPPPEIIVRPAAVPPPAAAPRPAAAAGPVAPAAQQSFLVPQMSYALQPVVTMQAVPTVSYGVVTGPVQPAGAFPCPPAGAFPAPGFAPYPAQAFGPPAAPCNPDLQAQVQEALKAIKALKGAGPAQAADPVAELNAEIARVKEQLADDLLRLGTATVKNKKDIEAILTALTESDNFEAARAKLKQLTK